MTFVLFDNIVPFPFDFRSRFQPDYDEMCSPDVKPIALRWLTGAWKALGRTHKNDVIVCWYDFQAVILYWLGKISFRPRKIACVNLLLKDKDTLVNKIVRHLYKGALADKNFLSSVTATEYGNHLKEMLFGKGGYNGNDFFLLHDPLDASYKATKSIPVQPGTVFCGGHNGRDWDFIIRLAAEMPEVTFKLVMPQSVYLAKIDSLSPNVVVRHSIPFADFLNELCSSELVCLPLNTEAPAGLVVMYEAAANNKMVITTSTQTTREYCTPDRGVALPNDIEEWKNAVRYYLSHKDEREAKAAAMSDFLTDECTENRFLDNLERMVKKLTV